MKQSNYKIIALGGSIILPDKINVKFLKKFHSHLLKWLKEEMRFVIVIGGGRLSRLYQDAASKIVKVVPEDLDWIGIHVTRINAHLLRTIFRKEAYPIVLDDPQKPIQGRPNLIFAAGWKPGWSTDYVTMLLAKRFGAKEVFVAGKPDYVYDKDFVKHNDAHVLKRISWQEYRQLISNKWIPGLKAPVDPIAAKFAQQSKIKAVILNGEDLDNLHNALKDKKFKGSTIYS